MKITVLVENVGGCGCRGAHGLSNLVETEGHTVLFDAGPDGDLLEENAAALGVDLTGVDTAVLSHAHGDHGGGMLRFLERNAAAPLYLHKRALLGCRVSREGKSRDGWRDALIEARGERIVPVGDVYRLDGELLLFADISGGDMLPGNNALLKELRNGEIVQEDFRHEQNLLVTEGDRAVLLAGCSHRGILNILRRCEEHLGRAPDGVVAGFHLTSRQENRAEEDAWVRALGRELKKRENTRFITGHCTGLGPYEILREELGDRLSYMSSGSVFEF